VEEVMHPLVYQYPISDEELIDLENDRINLIKDICGVFAVPRALLQSAAERKRYNVDRTVKVGEKVIYHNPVGKPFEALVTAVWGPKCINIVFVSGDTERTDSFGRQIERQTSLSHVSNSPVHGQYWRFEDETPNPIVEPLEK
jgi:hypothetical protein